MPTTVLIVDDHAGFRRSARELLESEGFEVVGEAAGGEEAIRVAGRFGPDVVLLDVGLPDIDGFEVARRLVAGQDPPCVVMVSSREGEDFGSLVAECGACGFVAKSELSRESIESFRARRR